MKLFHLSDLHLGKKLNGFSLLEDQKFILGQILDMVRREAPDGVLVAGDVYDRPVPPADAVELFDDFLSSLSGLGVQVYIISGNHDSPERIAFGYRLMGASGVHMSPVYDGQVTPLQSADAFGTVNFYLLPFVKPANVRGFFPEREIVSYTDALRAVVEQMELDPGARNVLLTHQFVTGAARAESEDVSVGGTDNVDGGVFDAFDYVALGHIHSPQNVGRACLRYCGTPLKYSISEAEQTKSVTVVELGVKGSVDIRTLPLTPLRELRQIRGDYMTLASRSFYAGTATDDYIQAVLTDENDVPDAMARLQVIYPHLTDIRYDNLRTRTDREITGAQAGTGEHPLALFDRFYALQNNAPLSEEQRKYLSALIEKIWEAQP